MNPDLDLHLTTLIELNYGFMFIVVLLLFVLRFLKRVKNNETASVEVQQFFKSSEFQDIKLSVSSYFNGT